MKTLIFIMAFLFGYGLSIADVNPYWAQTRDDASFPLMTCAILPPIQIEAIGGSATIRIVKGTKRTGLSEAAGFIVTGLPLGGLYEYKLTYIAPPYADDDDLVIDGDWRIYNWNTDVWDLFNSGAKFQESADPLTPTVARGLDVQFLVNEVDAQDPDVLLGLHLIPVYLNVEYVAI